MFRYTRVGFPNMTQRTLSNVPHFNFFKLGTTTTERAMEGKPTQAEIMQKLADPKFQWEEAIIDEQTLDRFQNTSETTRKHTSY